MHQVHVSSSFPYMGWITVELFWKCVIRGTNNLHSSIEQVVTFTKNATIFVFCRVPYIIQLLTEGLGLPEAQVTVGSGREGWTLGAALAEGSKALHNRSSKPSLIPGQFLLLLLVLIYILQTAAWCLCGQQLSICLHRSFIWLVLQWLCSWQLCDSSCALLSHNWDH